jgi:hypothetical protein
MTEGYPEPVRRWLARSTVDGAVTGADAVGRFTTTGTIRVGRWRRYVADWYLAPPTSFEWAARTRLAGVPVAGSDRFRDGTGAMRWQLFGRLPLIDATGPDVSRSAAGRLASEMFFVPAAARAAVESWRAVSADQAVAKLTVGEWPQEVRITVGPDGVLRRVELQRWGKPSGRQFALHTFVAEFDDGEIEADGVRIPRGGRAGWWRCPDGCARDPFFTFEITRAMFRGRRYL